MALINTKKSFSDQLNDIQSIFQTAKTKAQTLAAAMVTEKANKTAAIAKLNEEISVIETVEQRNNAFIESLEKFV